MNKIAYISLVTILSVFVSSCEDKKEDATQKNQVQAPPPNAKFEKDEWIKAFKSTFSESDVRVNDDGVKSYRACFLEENESDKKECKTGIEGKHDGFRKIDHLTPPKTAWEVATKEYSKNSFIGIYIAARECNAPLIFLAPVVKKNGWLFMNQISLMADGDLVIDKRIDTNSVEQNIIRGSSIEEISHVALNEKDIESFERFMKAEKQIIRITGKDNKYLTFNENDLSLDGRVVLEVYKKIQSSLKTAGGPVCSS